MRQKEVVEVFSFVRQIQHSFKDRNRIRPDSISLYAHKNGRHCAPCLEQFLILIPIRPTNAERSISSLHQKHIAPTGPFLAFPSGPSNLKSSNPANPHPLKSFPVCAQSSSNETSKSTVGKCPAALTKIWLASFANSAGIFHLLPYRGGSPTSRCSRLLGIPTTTGG